MTAPNVSVVEAGWQSWPMSNLDTDAPEGADKTLARLLAQARDWLTLCGIDRLITCAYPEELDEIDALYRHGFREVTRTARGWELRTV